MLTARSTAFPFMPEMVEYCGRRVQVLRKAEKTCVELPGGYYQMREFFQNDVFLLDELRCSGADHDGCQRLCMFHWKAAWLIPSPNAADRERPSQTGLTALRSALKTKSAPNRYFCQSTQIALATRPEPLKRVQILQKCFRDVRSGAVSVPKMIGLIIVPLYRKIRDRIVGRPRLVGTLKRTPVGTLALQPGEVVEIKSLEEMRQTLDDAGATGGSFATLS